MIYRAKNREITTQEQARQYAIDWQQWASKHDLSYQDLTQWGGLFTELAEKFDLTEEFKENGII